MKKRIVWLDFAKGFTQFLVVLAHVTSNILNHSEINSTTVLNLIRGVSYFSYLIIMPVFFTISGYLFKGNIKNRNGYVFLLKKKLVQLGIPYVAFSVFLVPFSLMLGVNTSVVKSYYDLFPDRKD